jgi:hypothetical protein
VQDEDLIDQFVKRKKTFKYDLCIIPFNNKNGGKARVAYRVINYPEFVNRMPGDTFVMEYDYVEIAHIRNALKKSNIEKANPESSIYS